MKRVDTVTLGWNEYELIDSGEGRKLERFSGVFLDRPDPQALWEKERPTLWERAVAHFTWKEGHKEKAEKWRIAKKISNEWQLKSHGLTLTLSFGKFKHIGIFPEHEHQWRELFELCNNHKGLRVLNLFGYTGAASLAAAKGGAKVTHVDASKQTIGIVKENIRRSELPGDALRLVCEDALKYAKRLVSRGEQFDAIIMDPPAFGRGPKGEVWKIEEKLPELITLIPKLLSTDARLVLLNGYAAGYSARSFGELLSDVFRKKRGRIFYGDVGIQQKNSDRVLSTGIYAKWESI